MISTIFIQYLKINTIFKNKTIDYYYKIKLSRITLKNIFHSDIVFSNFTYLKNFQT